MSSASNRCRLQIVLAASPKNSRRMSLSMPTTSSPLAAKNRAASAPIRPAEPVITATAIPRTSSIQYRLDLFAVLAQPLEDAVKYFRQRKLGTPTGGCCNCGIVRHIVRDVYRIGFRSRSDDQMLASVSYTHFGEFCEGHTAVRAAAHIEDFPAIAPYLRHLFAD